MRIQVLISTMNRKTSSLLNRMNIQSDAIVINQSNGFEYRQIKKDGYIVDWFTFNERGVGLSRNSALMRVSADIGLFADDDVKYVDGYQDIVVEAFAQNPGADILFFNFESQNKERPEYMIRKKSRVFFYNSLRYGAFRIAFRSESLKKANISFSLLFGGGAKYSSGEDSLFIYQAIKKGLRAYALPIYLGTVDQKESTWFKGYTDRFFRDKGALFKAISKKLYIVFIVYYVVRNCRSFQREVNPYRAFVLAIQGARKYGK